MQTQFDCSLGVGQRLDFHVTDGQVMPILTHNPIVEIPETHLILMIEAVNLIDFFHQPVPLAATVVGFKIGTPLIHIIHGVYIQIAQRIRLVIYLENSAVDFLHTLYHRCGIKTIMVTLSATFHDSATRRASPQHNNSHCQ